jgi:hypothetical protein
VSDYECRLAFGRVAFEKLAHKHVLKVVQHEVTNSEEYQKVVYVRDAIFYVVDIRRKKRVGVKVKWARIKVQNVEENKHLDTRFLLVKDFDEIKMKGAEVGEEEEVDLDEFEIVGVDRKMVIAE